MSGWNRQSVFRECGTRGALSQGSLHAFVTSRRYSLRRMDSPSGKSFSLGDLFHQVTPARMSYFYNVTMPSMVMIKSLPYSRREFEEGIIETYVMGNSHGAM